MIEKVRKRDGRIVLFDKNKIAEAIWKAAQAVGGKDKELAYKLADKVVELLEKQLKPGEIPTVEQIQDFVEKVLVENGHYKTAKAYITYRKKKEEIRNEKIAILQGFYEEQVAKKFSVNALRLMASRYLLKNEEGKLIEGPKQLFERVAMLVVIPDLLYDKRVFDKEGKQKVWEKEDFNPEEYERKLGFKNGNEQVFWNRYHLERMKNLYDELNSQGKMKVPWKEFFEMVKKGEFENYSKNFKEYFDLMVNKKFLPNSPTLFNAGARLGQLSACFVLDIDDNMESIMDSAKECALIFKSGGGIGINYSKLRPEGDIVASTTGTASGPVSFMKIVDVVTDVVKQGGCVSLNSFLFTNLGILKASNLPVFNPKDDYPLPVSVYDGNSYTDAFLGSIGNPQEMIAFETEHGYTLKVTPEDLVATINENGEIEFKRAIEIKENDYLVLSLGEHIGKEVRLEPINSQHFNSNKLTIPEYLSEDLAEILGIYMADGCFNNGRLIISFDAKRRNVFEYFKEKIRKTLNLEVEEIRDKRSYIDAVWFSRDLERYFEKREWKKEKSTKAFIPLDILISKKSVISAFLRGLFEGDGFVHSSGYPVLYTTSQRLAKEVQISLLSLGIISSIRKLNAKEISGHKGKEDVYTVSIIERESVEKFLSNIGFISEEKNEKVRKALNKKFEYTRVIPFAGKKLRKVYEKLKKKDRKKAARFYRKAYKYILGYRNFTFNALKNLKKDFEEVENEFKDFEKFVCVKVKNVEKIKEEVFHIETLSGKFVCNGFLVHNKRRGANMGILEAWHPDILKFIHAKEKEGQFENFNISILLDEKFWEAYNKGEKYALINPRNGKVVNYIDPKFLLEEAARMAWATADPGVLFLDNINRRNIQKEKRGLIRATNPCAEQPLYPYESCNLGSINLYSLIKFDEKGNAYFDWEEYKKVIEVSYRFLDNIIDVNKYPFEKLDRASKNTRRIGLGYMGLADAMFALKIPYSSEEGFDFIQKVSEFLTYYAMKNSVERAKERGVFPYYDLTTFGKGEMPIEGFYHPEIWSLDWKELQQEIIKFGLRNVDLTTVAPTGSISMFFDISSGIEPQFSLVFEKRVTVGSFYYVDIEFERQLKQAGLYSEELLKKIAENAGSVQGIEEIPEEMRKVFVTALDIPWWDHVRAQASAQLWITNSISKTINMPSFATVEDVLQAYLTAYYLGCKGITIYREGSKSKQVLYVGGNIEENRIREYMKLIKNDTLKILKKFGLEEPKWIKEIGMKELVKNNSNNMLERCPSCNSTNLAYQSGCVTCLNCGWSACLIS